MKNAGSFEPAFLFVSDGLPSDTFVPIVPLVANKSHDRCVKRKTVRHIIEFS